MTQKTNHTTRENAENTLNVALQSAGTYVDSHFSKEAYEASVKLASDATALAAVKWATGRRALVSKGKHGTLVRFGEVSECGEWMKYKGRDGAAKFVRRDILADGIRALTLAELVESCAKANDLRCIVQRNDNDDSGVKAGEAFYGFMYGRVQDSYATLVYCNANGTLLVKDVEIKANDYNEKALVSLGDVAEAEKKRDALRAKLLACAATGNARKVSGGARKAIAAGSKSKSKKAAK